MTHLTTVKGAPRDIRALPLDELMLPTRPYNALMRHGLTTVGDLLALCEDDLRDVRNLGPRSIGEIHAALDSVGLCLAPNYRERRTVIDEFAAATKLPLPSTAAFPPEREALTAAGLNPERAR